MERLAIETGLDAGKTPYAIARELGRPPKTVMREIRGRAVATDKGAASGDKPPYALMTQRFGVAFADLFNIRRIPANDVVLKPSLLGIEQKVRPEMLKATDPKNSRKWHRRHNPPESGGWPPQG